LIRISPSLDPVSEFLEARLQCVRFRVLKIAFFIEGRTSYVSLNNTTVSQKSFGPLKVKRMGILGQCMKRNFVTYAGHVIIVRIVKSSILRRDGHVDRRG
jgi:hypothetical protein